MNVNANGVNVNVNVNYPVAYRTEAVCETFLLTCIKVTRAIRVKNLHAARLHTGKPDRIPKFGTS